MMTHKKPPLSTRIANGFGKTAYFFVVIQWLFTFLLYFGWISTYFLEPMQPKAQPQPQPVPQPAMSGNEAPSLTTLIILAVIVIVMAALAVYAFIRLPKMVSGAGQKTVQAVAQQAAPLALKVAHAPVTEKNTRAMGAKLIAIFKALTLLLPIAFAALSRFIDQSIMSFDDALIVTLVLSVPGIILFSIQYLIARVYKTPLRTLV